MNQKLDQKLYDTYWSEVVSAAREASEARPFRIDEVDAELHAGAEDLTEEHVGQVVAFATSQQTLPPPARRYPDADPSVDLLLEEVSSCGLVSTAEIRALEAGNEEASSPRTSNDYLSEFARRNLLRTFDPRQLEGGLEKGVLFADYLLLDMVGVGGMGEVFRALHLRMNRIVALKVVSATAPGLRHNLTRFDSEVKALAKLNHPHIVTAYDASEAGGVPYLVMEFIDGSDLARLVYRIGALAPSLAVNYVLQVARGLDYAHKQGVIHRDVKPSNILLDSEGVIRISDLGLAKIVRDDGAAQGRFDATAVGTALGTYAYMSPEQADGSQAVDARSDIYALGCTLFFLLIGRSPATGSSNEAKMQWHREGVIPSLRHHLPDLPEPLDELFRRMLAKSPDNRPQTMGEVIEALEACRPLLGDSIADPAPVPLGGKAGAAVEQVDTARIGTADTARIESAKPAAASVRKRPTTFLLIVALALAVAGTTLLVTSVSNRHTRIVNDVGMSLTLVPPGEFWMGSNDGRPDEQPRHKVHISQPFFMGTFEVNRRQYQLVMDPNQPIPELNRRPDEPAVLDPGALPQANVTWDEAVEFCRKLSQRPAEVRAGRSYRLPTEAEWEYSCRAGTQTKFCWGDDVTLELANVGAEFRPPNTKFPGRPSLLEVGSFPPNPFGLHDMHGNALEWCKDRYGAYHADEVFDPQGPKEGDQRVVRGGATTYRKSECRSASRRYKHPHETNQFMGFRVVCEVQP